ncbi:MAG: RHS repeat-associated core domain-containing protein [Candidatus Eisenbacteria bacterium]
MPTLEAWSGAVAGSVSRQYDTFFRESTESVNGGSTVSYGYDADGLLTSAATTTATLSVHRQAATGLLDSTTVGVGVGRVGSTLSYDSHGDLQELGWTKGGVSYYHERIERDSLGRITQIDETIAGVSTSRTYGYDAAGRLTSVTEAGNPAANRGWEYDDNQPGNGNRTRATYGPGVPADTATYDVQDRLLSYGVSEYDWTAAGELLHRNRPGESLSTTYDVLGNLVSAALTGQVSGSQGSEPPPSTLVSYRVDGQNHRVERRVGGAGSPRTQRWLYRDGLAVVAELDSTNALVNRYVYGTQDHVPDLLVRAAGTYRVITDHLGSIRALVNITTGAVAQRIDYDAWGNETANTAPTLQALGYAGGLTDPETKFIRFGARDYDPGVGRWTAKDPEFPESGSTSAYVYVDSDPLDFGDASGASKGGRRNLDGDDPLLRKLREIWDRFAKGEISREEATRLSEELAKQAATSARRKQAFNALLKVLRRGETMCLIGGALLDILADPAEANPLATDGAPAPHVIPGIEVTARRKQNPSRREPMRIPND